eukprot:4659491-Pyramimonas_sp.AAC.1
MEQQARLPYCSRPQESQEPARRPALGLGVLFRATASLDRGLELVQHQAQCVVEQRHELATQMQATQRPQT